MVSMIRPVASCWRDGRKVFLTDKMGPMEIMCWIWRLWIWSARAGSDDVALIQSSA